jgi:hypothetical protein
MTSLELTLHLHESQDIDPLHHDFDILALDLSHRLHYPDLIPHGRGPLCDLHLALVQLLHHGGLHLQERVMLQVEQLILAGGHDPVLVLGQLSP